MKQENPSAYKAMKPRLTTRAQTKMSRYWALRSALGERKGLALGGEVRWQNRRQAEHAL
jgi:hypothetical protein